MKITIEYFAQLRDIANTSTETVEGNFKDLAAVYDFCAQKHGFDRELTHLRVAKNAGFAEWSDAPAEGDRIVFIPPVTGG